MPDFFADPNFYVLLSFCTLVFFVYSKLRNKISEFLTNYADSVSKTMDNARGEKNKSLLDLTKTNQQVLHLPEEIAGIWKSCSVNTSQLQEEIAKEIEKIEYTGQMQLEYTRKLQMQAEYWQYIDALCQKFKQDVQECDMCVKNAIMEQSIGLLGALSSSQIS
jgi:F0F1-type ATP synthase membrane subunit b/b'